MDDGDGMRSDDEEEIEDEEIEDEEFEEAAPLDAEENGEAGSIDLDEEPPKSSSPISIVMPCTSTTDPVGRPSAHGETPHMWDSDDIDRTDEGEDVEYDDAEDDDSMNQSHGQQQDLTVTFRSEETNEEIATATLILKRHDSVDKFLPFAGAVLRSIQNEPLKLKLMEDISQMLINAKTYEIQRHRRPRPQYIVVLFPIP